LSGLYTDEDVDMVADMRGRQSESLCLIVVRADLVLLKLSEGGVVREDGD
jgi:hypothetical protein